MQNLQGVIEAAKVKLAEEVVKHFDSQGFYVFTEGKGLKATSSTAVHASCNEAQLTIFITSLAKEIKPDEDHDQNLIGLLNEVFTNHPQAITNLERAFKDKFAQIARSYQTALEGKHDEQINGAYQETIEQSMPAIREKFIESLRKSISTDSISLNLVELNQQLDAQKQSIYKKMRKEFLEQCNTRNVPKADYDSLKKALHETTAFQEFEIYEITPYSANFIKTPTKSSHDYSTDIDADEPVHHCNGKGELKCKVIRLPIPIPPEKSYKGEVLTKAQIKDRQISDTVDRLHRIAKHQNFDSQKPIYECLLTSYHTGLKLWDGNEQTERANLLPKIQDRMNTARIKNGEKLYLPFLAPTNGFGEEIKTSTGFGGFFRNLKIEELAWRNNMALAMQLGTDTQKDSILEKYNSYLNDPNDPDKKTALRDAIKEVQSNMKFDDQDSKEKKVLKIMFKHNLHEKKEFARTTATLFCANADNQVIVGCKSGNERTAIILHRLEALYDGPKGGAIEQFTCNNRGEQHSAPQEVYKHYLDHKGAAEERLIGFTKALEEQVNVTNLYGTANHISSKDTGADHKITSNSGYSFSTNAAESKRLNLETKGNARLQSHNDHGPLEDLAYPKDKPGLLANVWKYLKGLFSNSNSNSTTISEANISPIAPAAPAASAASATIAAQAPVAHPQNSVAPSCVGAIQAHSDQTGKQHFSTTAVPNNYLFPPTPNPVDGNIAKGEGSEIRAPNPLSIKNT